jgi:hypothetical protein
MGYLCNTWYKLSLSQVLNLVTRNLSVLEYLTLLVANELNVLDYDTYCRFWGVVLETVQLPRYPTRGGLNRRTLLTVPAYGCGLTTLDKNLKCPDVDREGSGRGTLLHTP